MLYQPTHLAQQRFEGFFVPQNDISKVFGAKLTFWKKCPVVKCNIQKVSGSKYIYGECSRSINIKFFGACHSRMLLAEIYHCKAKWMPECSYRAWRNEGSKTPILIPYDSRRRAARTSLMICTISPTNSKPRKPNKPIASKSSVVILFPFNFKAIERQKRQA